MFIQFFTLKRIKVIVLVFCVVNDKWKIMITYLFAETGQHE